MAFEIPKQDYSGKIREVVLGQGDKAITIGGQDSYPFYLFEGNMPNPPKIAMEIWDYNPSEEWPKAVVEPFKDVMDSPDAWAKKCVEEYGADLIVVQLKSTDPNGMNRGPDEAVEVAKKVLDAVDVPVIFWGTTNNQKDEEVLKAIAEATEGKNVGLAPVEEANHKGIGASALGYGHTIVASSPIDVNLAKQLNILLENLGVQIDKIVIDPTTGGLGYGLEYSYSVMERIRMAALTQEDDKLQIPMISNIGNEVWKCKEAGQGIEEAPTLGDTEKRGIMMEVVSAVCYLMAGADVVVLRHPESVRLTSSFIDLLIKGGMATEVEGVSKRLELEKADLLSISPEPDLTIKEEAPKPPKKEKPKAPPPTKEEKVVEEKRVEEKKVVELKPKEEPKEEAPKVEKAEEVKISAEEEEKKRAEEEIKRKLEEEMKKKAEEEAKARAEEEAKKRAEEEARRKEEEEERKRKEAEEKEKADLEEIIARVSRAMEQRKKEKAPAGVIGEVKSFDMDLTERITVSLKRMHKHS